MTAVIDDTSNSKPQGNRRWFAVFSLSAASFVDGGEDQALSILWPYMHRSLGLSVGQLGVIHENSFEKIPLSLLEMGCMPGAEVQLLQVAPLNDPLYICVNGSHLAIRRETASEILVTIV